MNEFMTFQEVCARVGLTDKTVRKMWRQGDFPMPRKHGYKKLIFRRSEIEAWIRGDWNEQSAA